MIQRATDVLGQHERVETPPRIEDGQTPVETQEKIFDLMPESISEELRNLELDRLSPLEALWLLQEWRQRIDA